MDIVALLEVLVKEIIAAEEKFLKNPKDFYSLETSVKASTENFSAGFLSAVLRFRVMKSSVSLPEEEGFPFTGRIV